MALHRTRAVVLGRRPLGENDRLVEFYTRDLGRLRGVAQGARRPRSRFGSALEPFTHGELVFFESPRSELIRINLFDIIEPFLRVREHLDRLGRGAWAMECLARLSAERDPQPALYRLLVRSLRALEAGRSPGRVAACFALRAVDLLGHRPRMDRCVGCGRPYPFPGAALDAEAGGLLCRACAGPQGLQVSGSLVGAVRRLRDGGWEDGLRLPLSRPLEGELALVLEAIVTRLMGHAPRASRFLAQTGRSLAAAEPPGPPGARG
jgi:DNA repair protein RecO (recombination protein O)